MTSKQISAWLVVALAIIAAITAVGFIAGYSMQPFIVGYFADLKKEEEAPDISAYSACGFEDYDTLDDAKARVVCALGNDVDSAISDLEEIAELFS